eukprot:539832_1
MTLFKPTEAALVIGYVTAIIYFKFLITLLIQARRIKRPAEDAKLPAVIKGKRKSKLRPNNEDEQIPINNQQDANNDKKNKFERSDRWARITMNDLENIPFATIIWWVCVFVNASVDIYPIVAIIWCISRMGHTYLYAHAIQPWRTYVYILSKLCEMIGIAVILIKLHQNL